MWEYGIRNARTGEKNIIFGYSPENAFDRNPEFNPSEWYIWYSEYID